MICRTCAHAADHRLGREHHCLATGEPGGACDCQHRVERYRALSVISRQRMTQLPAGTQYGTPTRQYSSVSQGSNSASSAGILPVHQQ